MVGAPCHITERGESPTLIASRVSFYISSFLFPEKKEKLAAWHNPQPTMLGDENDPAIQTLLQGKDSRVVQIVRKRRMKPPAPTLFPHENVHYEGVRSGPLREQLPKEVDNKANQYTKDREIDFHGNDSKIVSIQETPPSIYGKKLEGKSRGWTRANGNLSQQREMSPPPQDTSKTPKVTNTRKPLHHHKAYCHRSRRHKKRVQFQAILATIYDSDWAMEEEEVQSLWYSGEEIEANVEFLGNVDTRGSSKKHSQTAHWWKTLARLQKACSVMVSKDEYRIHKSSDMALLRQELAIAYVGNVLNSDGERDYECWGLERMSFDSVRAFYRETMLSYLEHFAQEQEDTAIAASLLQRLSLPFGLYAQELAMAQAQALALEEKALFEKEQGDYNRHEAEAEAHAPRSPSERRRKKQFCLPKPKNLASVRKGSFRPVSPTF